VPATWLVSLINEYGLRPRAEAGESDAPYPDLTDLEPTLALAIDQTDRVLLAERLWPVFGEPSPTGKAAALNGLLAAASLTPVIGGDSDSSWFTGHSQAREIIQAGCAVALLDAVRARGWSRLGTCAGDDCLDVYLAQEGRRPRRYCSAACLNRSRIRAYRARRKREAATATAS
jgi:hypothetical protein